MSMLQPAISNFLPLEVRSAPTTLAFKKDLNWLGSLIGALYAEGGWWSNREDPTSILLLFLVSSFS